MFLLNILYDDFVVVKRQIPGKLTFSKE